MLFRNSSFRNLFLGRIFSVLADSVMFFSLLKWIEIQSNGSGSFTWFYVAYYLPVTFLAIPVGTWIENKTLQKVMIFSDGIRVVLLLIFPLLMYVDFLSVDVFIINDGKCVRFVFYSRKSISFTICR